MPPALVWVVSVDGPAHAAWGNFVGVGRALTGVGLSRDLTGVGLYRALTAAGLSRALAGVGLSTGLTGVGLRGTQVEQGMYGMMEAGPGTGMVTLGWVRRRVRERRAVMMVAVVICIFAVDLEKVWWDWTVGWPSVDLWIGGGLLFWEID